VHGNLYGTRARVLEDALASAATVLLDIDTQGAAQLRARYPDAVAGVSSWRRRSKISRRGSASGAPTRSRRSSGRLARAREEIALWRRYDYLIVNRDVKEALDQLESIIHAERCRVVRLGLTLPDLEVQS